MRLFRLHPNQSVKITACLYLVLVLALGVGGAVVGTILHTVVPVR